MRSRVLALVAVVGLAAVVLLTSGEADVPDCNNNYATMR